MDRKTITVVIVTIVVLFIIVYMYNKRNNKSFTVGEVVLIGSPLIAAFISAYQAYQGNQKDIREEIQNYQKSASVWRDPIMEYIIAHRDKLKILYSELFPPEAESTGVIVTPEDVKSPLNDEEMIIGHKIIKSCEVFSLLSGKNEIKFSWLCNIIIWMRSERLRKIWNVIDYSYSEKVQLFINLCIRESSLLSKIPTKEELKNTALKIHNEFTAS